MRGHWRIGVGGGMEEAGGEGMRHRHLNVLPQSRVSVA